MSVQDIAKSFVLWIGQEKKNQAICVFSLMKKLTKLCSTTKIAQKLLMIWKQNGIIIFLESDYYCLNFTSVWPEKRKRNRFFFSYCTDLPSYEIHPDEYATL